MSRIVQSAGNVVHSASGRPYKNSNIAGIVLLNYNGSRYLRRLLSSLNDQSLSSFEIIFVDNASLDDSVTVVRRLRKTLRNGLTLKIIENERNFGYCKGNNIGALAAESDTKYLVFLNNDTYVDVNWLQNLVQKAESNSELGMVGCKIDPTMEGPAIIAWACDVYGQSDSVILPTANRRKTDYADLKFFYCSGASLLVPKKVFWEVGGFDEALFMYQDDMDLCWRIRLCGYGVTVEPSSVCHHVTNYAAIGLNLPVWKFYHGIVKNRIRVSLKNYATTSILRYFSRTVALILLRGLLSSLVNKNARYIMALFDGFLWNIKNLRATQLKRLETQLLRKVPDKNILANMSHHSIEIAYFRRFLVHI
jgi:GT2 family glycosyltransferase